MCLDRNAIRAAGSRGSRLGLAQPEVNADTAEDAEILQASIRAGSVAQIVVAVIAVIGLIYLLKLVLVTTLASLLLAFVLEPLVGGLVRIHVPRFLGALLAVVLMVGLAAGLTFFFYGRAVDFATQLPRYSGKIHSSLAVLREQTRQIEESTRSVIASPRAGKAPLAVEVQEAPGLSRVISAGGGTLGELFLAISFVPFLVYFMLTWKDYAHSTTVRLFPKEHRLVAHRTVGRISGDDPWFYRWQCFDRTHQFPGQYDRVLAAGHSLLLFPGSDQRIRQPRALRRSISCASSSPRSWRGNREWEGVLAILLTVVGLHVVTLNVLYPKIVGKRLRLNPLAITLSLLFWAWIWGAMGLILAVPIVGATKIICDYIDPLRGLGAWLGD